MRSSFPSFLSILRNGVPPGRRSSRLRPPAALMRQAYRKGDAMSIATIASCPALGPGVRRGSRLRVPLGHSAADPDRRRDRGDARSALVELQPVLDMRQQRTFPTSSPGTGASKVTPIRPAWSSSASGVTARDAPSSQGSRRWTKPVVGPRSTRGCTPT